MYLNYIKGKKLSNSILVNLSFIISKPTGITNYALNILPNLQQLNPTLLTSKIFEGFQCHPIADNLTPEQGTQGHFRRLAWTQFQLPKIYRQLQGRLLFSPLPEAPLTRDCRFVVMVHDLIPLRFVRPLSPLTPYFRYYIREVLKKSLHILCNSTATARDIGNFYSIPAAKITSIPLAYDSNHFRPLNLPIQPYFLYIGRPDPHKNLPRLLEAFAHLRDQDCQLWIAGPVDRRYTPILQAQVQELGLQSKVKFLEYLPYDRLPILINQAIALVFPSLWEGFGLPVLEALGCGTPVITSNISSLPEVVGDAGILVNPYQREEITAAMVAMLKDQQLRSRLSVLALERADQFSWAKTGEATAEILLSYI